LKEASRDARKKQDMKAVIIRMAAVLSAERLEDSHI
jgi:hypothetical protein